MAVGMPMERLHIDLTGLHPRSNAAYMYILTCLDPFTKFAEGIALRNKSATTVAKVLVEQIFTRYGLPLSLLSDQGCEFDNALMLGICQRLQVDKIRTTAYKPSTNGAVERLHRTLNSMMGKMVAENQKNWSDVLPFVMAAYRASKHEGSHYSPNFLVFGREVHMPIDLAMGTMIEEKPKDIDEYAQELIDRQQRAYDLVREHLRMAAERNTRYYDMKVKPVTFSVGEWVYVYNPRRYKNRS